MGNWWVIVPQVIKSLEFKPLLLSFTCHTVYSPQTGNKHCNFEVGQNFSPRKSWLGGNEGKQALNYAIDTTTLEIVWFTAEAALNHRDYSFFSSKSKRDVMIHEANSHL